MYIAVKNYENRSIFARVITKINVSRFFYGPLCICEHKGSTWSKTVVVSLWSSAGSKCTWADSGPLQLWTHNCIPPLSSWHQMSLSVVTRSSTCVVSMMRWSQTTKLWRRTFSSGSERRSRSWTIVISPTHSPEFRTCYHSLTVTGRLKNHQS